MGPPSAGTPRKDKRGPALVLGWDRPCNRETLGFLEKNIEKFLKTVHTWARRVTHGGEWNPGRKAEREKLLCPEGFSEQGTWAEGLHESEGLWDQPTRTQAHAKWGGKGRILPHSAGTPKSRPQTETQFTTPHSGWPSFQSHMKA